MDHVDNLTEKAYKLVTNANNEMDSIFIEHVLFTKLWWLGVFLSIIPWILWIFFRRKESSDRLMYAALFVMLISLLFDTLGVRYHLWIYGSEVIPAIPGYEPWDFTLLPVTMMFLIQYKSKISPWIKAPLYGLITSYIGEPLFQWIGLYKPYEWKHYYSLPIYTLIYLAAHYLTTRNKFGKL